MIILPRQFRAARADLNMTLDDVSVGTGLGKGTISDIETAKTDNPRTNTTETLRLFYEARGIQFLENGGIAPQNLTVQQYQGEEGFRAFMNDVYEVAKAEGGDIRLHNAKPSNWIKWLGEQWNSMHTQRMLKIEKPMDYRITAGHGDTQLIGKHAKYRWLPKSMWNQQSFYAYGDRLALLTFKEESVHIVVIYNRELAQSFRAMFDVVWEHTSTEPEAIS